MSGGIWAQAAAKAVDQIIGVGSTFFGNQSNRHAQRRSYEYASMLQAQAQEWAEKMSNTAHQREMADLRAAGVNPLLTVTGGPGAPSYTSNAGTAIGANPAQNTKTNFWEMATTAKQLKMQQQQTDALTDLQKEQSMTEISKRQNLLSQSQLNEAQKWKAESEAILNDKTAGKFEKEWAYKMNEIASRIQMNQAVSALNASEIGRRNKLNKAEISAKEAETKFNNERSRGYTITSPEGWGEFSRNIGRSYNLKVKNAWRRED